MPLAILISLFIFFEDYGTVIFMQRRIGLNQQPFTLYKFRSMTNNKNLPNGSFEAGDQSRVTKIGKLLRKTKIDEFPQLINVLSGKMSLVGPRPEVKKWVDMYPQQWAVVLTVKPGLTDNASILFRNEEELLSKVSNPAMHYKEVILPRKLSLYSEYIKNQSFIGDLKIILKTLYSISKKQNV